LCRCRPLGGDGSRVAAPHAWVGMGPCQSTDPGPSENRCNLQAQHLSPALPAHGPGQGLVEWSCLLQALLLPTAHRPSTHLSTYTHTRSLFPPPLLLFHPPLHLFFLSSPPPSSSRPLLPCSCLLRIALCWNWFAFTHQPVLVVWILWWRALSNHHTVLAWHAHPLVLYTSVHLPPPSPSGRKEKEPPTPGFSHPPTHTHTHHCSRRPPPSCLPATIHLQPLSTNTTRASLRRPPSSSTSRL